MSGFDAHIDSRLPDRHKTVSVNQQESETRIGGIQFFDDLPHHKIGHGFVDLVSQPGNRGTSLGASHKPLEFRDGTGTIARRALDSQIA